MSRLPLFLAFLAYLGAILKALLIIGDSHEPWSLKLAVFFALIAVPLILGRRR